MPVGHSPMDHLEVPSHHRTKDGSDTTGASHAPAGAV